MQDLVWIEVSRSRAKNNMRILRSLIDQQVLLAPCVKSNAYGHGLVKMAQLLVDEGVDWLSVTSLAEAEILRKSKINQPILVMGYIPDADLPKIFSLKVRFFVSDYSTARKISLIAQKLHQQAIIHIKVDTGMGRIGVLAVQAKNLIQKIRNLPYLTLEGIATHFATADVPTIAGQNYFHQQLVTFQQILTNLQQKEISIPLIHCANSAATLLEKGSHFNLVRPGLAVYGYYPNELAKKICSQQKIKLLPVLAVKTKIALVKEILTGSKISYGSIFVAKRKTKIAVLSIGYYDGLDRKLSNKGYVLIKGKKAKILGRVCMNMTVVDITYIKNISPGEEVVIIGKQGQQEITADDIARLTNTISDEVLTNWRESISRYYKA